MLAVLVASIVAARAVGTWATRRQNATGQRPNTTWINLAILVVPIAATLFALGLHWEVPELRGFNFRAGS